MGKPDKKLKKIIIVLGITGAVYIVFRYLIPLVIPFLIAWGLAALLRPSALWLSRHLQVQMQVRGKKRRFGLPVGAAGMAELLLLMILLGTLLYWGGRKLYLEASMFIGEFPEWVAVLDRYLTDICNRLELRFCLRPGALVFLAQEMIRGMLRAMKQAAMPYLMVNSVSVFRWGVGAAVFLVVLLVSVGLALQEMDDWRDRCRQSLYRRELKILGHRLSVVANAYFKTQGVIMLLTSAICTAGFWAMGNPYYLLGGLGIGLLDALPIFGTGTVLLPWAIGCFLGRRWGKGIALIALYLGCYFLREILEAKMMGEKAGMGALETLMSMYVGLELFGIAGFLLGPIGVLVIRDLTALAMGEEDETFN